MWDTQMVGGCGQLRGYAMTRERTFKANRDGSMEQNYGFGIEGGEIDVAALLAYNCHNFIKQNPDSTPEDAWQYASLDQATFWGARGKFRLRSRLWIAEERPMIYSIARWAPHWGEYTYCVRSYQRIDSIAEIKLPDLGQ